MCTCNLDETFKIKIEKYISEIYGEFIREQKVIKNSKRKRHHFPLRKLISAPEIKKQSYKVQFLAN